MKKPWDQPLETLRETAIAALARRANAFERWLGAVRDPEGRPGRFRWASETSRPANVAATHYMLGALMHTGLFDRMIGAEDAAGGLAWVASMERDGGQCHDPALLDRPAPARPGEGPWPGPAMLQAVNQYALGVRRRYNGDEEIERHGEILPPPGWPQPGDPPEATLEWIKTRPYDRNAWSACSHGMRMATLMLQWHREGRFGIEPVIEAVRFFYEIQDPETGLWGTADQPRNVRINGTFKLFPLLREQLDLPIPRAGRIIDQVISEWARPDYDAHASGCDEWDNAYVVALLRPLVPGHRGEEIERLAAYRIARTLEVFGKDDGGLSFHPDHASTHWNGFDMVEGRVAESDAQGAATLTRGINVCIDLAGLTDATSWTGRWRLRPGAREPEAIRRKFLDAIAATSA